MKKNDKLLYTHINIIKIFACFLVIINHTINHILLYEVKGVNFFFCLLFSLCKIAVPLFIACSGYLLLSKNYSYKKVFKSIFKIIVPLLVLSAFLYIKDTGIKNINISEFFSDFLSKPAITPYWYLYMLVGLYFITPFMQKMVKNFENKDYYFFIIFFIFIPAFLKMLLVCFGIKYSSYWLISFIPYTIGYFVYGNFLEKNPSFININIARIVFIISFVGMFLLTYIPYVQGQGISYKFDDVSSLPVALMSLSAFYIINYRFKEINYNNVLKKVINTIGSTTFGIYLLHHLIGYRIFTNGLVQSIFNFNAFTGYIICVFLIFIICSIITFILKQIPIVKKFL